MRKEISRGGRRPGRTAAGDELSRREEVGRSRSGGRRSAREDGGPGAGRSGGRRSDGEEGGPGGGRPGGGRPGKRAAGEEGGGAVQEP
jgi:hypothetical protein